MEQKEINKIKLAITTECNLACPYCFVESRNDWMSWTTAKAAIDILLKSTGQDKLLSIYGGEPLLHFLLVKRMVLYARSHAKRMRKALTINLCTNLLLADQEILLFLKKHDVKVIVSVFGHPREHDRVRKGIDGRGTYEALSEKIKLLFRIFSTWDVGVAFCVDPKGASRLRSNWEHLMQLGFRHFNVEIIREYGPWTLKRQKEFLNIFSEIISETLFRIGNGKRIYFNPINWELKHSLLSSRAKGECLFKYHLEVYPKGQMAFSPFLLNSQDPGQYVVGYAGKPLDKFKGCFFDGGSKMCQKCSGTYFHSSQLDPRGQIIFERSRDICLKAAQLIFSCRRVKNYRNYIHSVNNQVCF